MLIAALLLLLALAGRKSRALLLIGAVLFGSLVMSLRQDSMQRSVVTNFFDKSARITAQISTDPTLTAPKVRGQYFAPRNYSFRAQATEIDGYSLRIPIRAIVSSAAVKDLLPGQTIRFNADVLVSKEARVAALVIGREKIEVLSSASRWAHALGEIRAGLRQISGDGDAGGLIPGMVLGDTTKQDAPFKEAMKRSGLTHLVAVSGANFAIVSTFILWLAQFLIRSMRWRLIFTALFLASFIALVRPSPSVLRAAAMASVLLIAKGSHRATDSIPALGFAIAAVIALDPWQARDPGFALSVLATAGLLLFAPKVIAFFTRWIPKLAAEALAPPIAAIVFCAPVLLSLSGYLSPMSIVANLLAAPAVAPITILGFLAALLHPVAPWVSELFIFLIRFPAAFIAHVAHWSARFPVIHMKVIFFLIFLTLSFLIFKSKKAIALTVALILLFAWFTKWPGSDWKVANCDIGQGDASVINLGSRSAIVIDTGPDPESMDRCLSTLGIKRIRLLVITHFHADHMGGISGAVRNRKVDEVWANTTDPSIHGLPIRIVHQGDRVKINELQIDVLWPQEVDEKNSNLNNISVATLIRSGDFSLFSGGDLEPIAQSQIAGQLPRVDIYKVCHHGSAFQDPAFTRALSPAIAMISVGAGNMYGHPAPETVGALTRLGARVIRTDISGAIAIAAHSHRFRIRTSRGGLSLITFG